MDYYDIDLILAEEEKVQVQFLKNAIHLGFLDSTSEEQDVRKFKAYIHYILDSIK